MITDLYKYLPVSLQNVACTLSGFKKRQLRFGGDFDRILEDLKQSEWYTKGRIEDYQSKHLQKIIKIAYENVPYYTKLFKKNNLRPKDIQCVTDLSKVPILTKEMVRNNYKDLINQSYKGKTIKAHTSGSTGKSLEFIMSREAIRYRWALWFRHRARFDIKVHDPYATFTGQVVIPLSQKDPPFWRENYSLNQTIFTMHHINREKTPSIVDRLNRGGFKYYAGYPSIIYRLAVLIEQLGLEITNPPEVIFTGAESLLETQRVKIAEIFKTFVTDQYGFSEGCGNASRCEQDLYHEDFEYGILEYDREELNRTNCYTGEVLATGFTNLAMPFIRYRVGDTATWSKITCKCGRNSQIIEHINGRNEDYVLTPEGNKILRFDYIFKDTTNVFEAQVVQYELGSITIKIVKRDDYSISDEDKIKNLIHKKISPSLKIKFLYVNNIEREQNGKFRAVKSYLEAK